MVRSVVTQGIAEGWVDPDLFEYHQDRDETDDEEAARELVERLNAERPAKVTEEDAPGYLRGQLTDAQRKAAEKWRAAQAAKERLKQRQEILSWLRKAEGGLYAGLAGQLSKIHGGSVVWGAIRKYAELAPGAYRGCWAPSRPEDLPEDSDF
jgi:hypothetical protein